MSENTQASRFIKFKSLPEQIQERILERQRGAGEGFAFRTAGIFPAYFFIAAAAVWLGIVFYLADDYLWSNFQSIVFAVVSLAAIYLLLENLHKLIRWFTSRSKSYLLITPHYVVETRFDNIWYWDLDKLVAANGVHRSQSERYTTTQITLSLENSAAKTFDVKGIADAEETIERIYHYKKLFAEASAKNDAAYLDANDDFAELRGQPRQTETAAPNENTKRLITAAASILLTAATMFGAVSLNNYCDDKKSWDAAESANRASIFRTYLQTHPHGRWADDARQKVQNLYDAAEQKYRASLNKGYDQKAADAVLQTLKYAKETQNYRVKVVFERHNEISPNVVEELKKEFEVKNILSLGDTFSDVKMTRRENGLLAVVADAFRQGIADDILEFSSECSSECINFSVAYKVGSKDSLYYDLRQKDLPEEDRTFYPGIFIDWDFGLKIPNQPHNYNFALASSPAAEISYDTNSDEENPGKEDFAKVLDADKSYIYDSMAASAFDDFKANLVYRMGIGAEPEKKDEDEGKTETAPTIKQEKRRK